MKIVLNHKCNFTKEEFLTYQESLSKINSNHDIILCPSMLYLTEFHLSNISLSSQDVSPYPNGNKTGDISAAQLKSVGVSYSLVGHSERRCYHHETDEEIYEKIKQLLNYDIIPILCIGETEEEREEKKTFEKVEKDLSILKNLTEEEQKKVIIAYEPIWAIGSGKTPSVSEIDIVLEYIRKIAPHNTLLYGGSVNEENILELKKSTYIQGYLIGGLSLNILKLKDFLTRC